MREITQEQIDSRAVMIHKAGALELCFRLAKIELEMERERLTSNQGKEETDEEAELNKFKEWLNKDGTYRGLRVVTREYMFEAWLASRASRR